MAVGHDLEQMLVGCGFQWTRLNCTAIAKTVFDGVYGKCFLIQLPEEQRMTSVGLLLLVDLHSELQLPELPMPGQSAVLSIEKEPSLMSMNRYFIQPGTITRISLRPVHYLLATNEGFRGCQNDMGHREFFNSSYSREVCEIECWARSAELTCGCFYPTPKAYQIKPYRVCQSKTELTCVDTVLSQEEYKECKINCLPSCDYWDYETSVTTGNFPSEEFVRYMKGEPVFGRQAFNIDWETRRKDLTLIKIGFDAMQYKTVEQRAAMTFEGFLSQIGGQLGLFLGASLLSVVQIFTILLQNLSVKKVLPGLELQSPRKTEWEDIADVKK